MAVNQDGVGERAEIIQSLSQLTLTALFTKESLAIRSVWNDDLQANKYIKESFALWIVYIKFRLQLTLQKIRNFAALV